MNHVLQGQQQRYPTSTQSSLRFLKDSLVKAFKASQSRLDSRMIYGKTYFKSFLEMSHCRTS